MLFVDRDVSAPQIAAGLLRRLMGERIIVDTATTEPTDPGGRSDEMLVAMGLDPAPEHQLRAHALYAANRVVILGADLDVARLPGPSYEEWDVEHDDLAERVQSLSDELTSVPSRRPRSGALDWWGRFFGISRR